jgi:hypothetical protein
MLKVRKVGEAERKLETRNWDVTKKEPVCGNISGVINLKCFYVHKLFRVLCFGFRFWKVAEKRRKRVETQRLRKSQLTEAWSRRARDPCVCYTCIPFRPYLQNDVVNISGRSVQQSSASKWIPDSRDGIEGPLEDT